jgi:FlaG/FlaF family flagellin (archaellin)
MFGSTITPDRRGVTPVGIVLLVAITILLASTVAAFAFSLEDESQPSNAPTVVFEVDYEAAAGDNDELRITHTSGGEVLAENLDVVVRGASCDASATDPNGRYQATSFLTGPVRAGMTMDVDGSGPITCTNDELNLGSATVRVVWNPGTGSSRTYRTWHGPG